MRALVRFLRLQWLRSTITEGDITNLLNASRITEAEADFIRLGEPEGA